MENEQEFEHDLIEYLQSIGGTKQWSYKSDIKTIDGLWANFRSILEANNADKLQGKPLSDAEFSQVQAVISNLSSPYEAGRWIYGMNGVTQVEVNRDDNPDGSAGEHIYLTVFDQSNVGAGNTVYQIVNQIERPHVLPGHKNRRFDTTLLINGLPIIHIEEKFNKHDAREALNQIHQYIDEGAFTGIYSTVQILVGITPHQALYMANTDSQSFNTDFAFHWQHEDDNKPVWDWREFANLMLSIPMAHQMSTSYMILDGEPKHKNLIVMRPHQVYATRRVIEAVRKHVFGTDSQEIGYVWHTTGSGKTISSFKTAWLASRLPNVDKVVFVVDRKALTKQTYEKYAAYDPNSDENNNNGIVSNTANTGVLARKIASTSQNDSIVVTSIQKLDRLCSRRSFNAPKRNILFIVDEAHRSTNGDMLKRIKKAFPFSGWVGYTGTPVFDGDLTQQAFGNLLHAYTIREAIADGTVLGFKVDFEHTLKDDEIKERLLPELLKQRHPNWNDDTIEQKIARMEPKEADSYIDSGIYDDNAEHVKAVVNDITDHWRNRSKEGRYSAILTTHVGGGKPSAPMALQYFDEFQRKNNLLEAEGKQPLNVAVTFSQATDNSEGQLAKNKGLRRAIDAYNHTFGTSFDDTTVDEYFDDVTERLKGETEGPKLDLVIVIDQLLTGYDAPRLNTLYVDRTLAGANLIQAYSRTNRIEDNRSKPWGRIVNYRWPETSKKLMDNALSVYANKDSAITQEPFNDLVDDDILAKPYVEMVEDTHEIVEQISRFSDSFSKLPDGENSKQEMAGLISRFNGKIAELKQCTEYDYDQPEKLRNELGITNGQEQWINAARYELQRWSETNKQNNLDLSMLDFEVEHIAEVHINYDYIDELLAKLLNEAYQGKDTKDTYSDFSHAVGQLDDRHLATQMRNTADDARQGIPITDKYPVQAGDVAAIVQNHAQSTRRKQILRFKEKWGLIDIATASLLIDRLIDRHTKDADDLNDCDELAELMNDAVKNRLYRQDAKDENIRNLTPVKYRNQFRDALRKFADFIVTNY